MTSQKGIGTIPAVVVTSVVVAIIVGSGTWFLAGGPAPVEEEKKLTVGVIGPTDYIQGEHHLAGARMAVEEINRLGGVLVAPGDRRKIELEWINSKEITSPTVEAPTAMEKLISDHDPDLIVGGFRTEGVLAMQEVAMDHKKLFLDCGAATPDICERVGEDYDRYKYTFRITPINSHHLGHTDFLGLLWVKTRLNKLGIENVRVAVIAEDAMWADPIVEAAKVQLPAMGMERVGIWRPSATATDISAEMSQIEAEDPHIIFTTFSGPVGITYGSTYGELEIPAISIGINVESQKLGYWDATDGYGNYDTSLNTYARTPISPLTIPFFDKFIDRTGEWPTYNAATYDAIYMWAEIVEGMVRHPENYADAIGDSRGPITQSISPDELEPLNTDQIIDAMEDIGTIGVPMHFREAPEGVGTGGALRFNENHDLKWWPLIRENIKYAVQPLFTQWQDGELVCVWPDEVAVAMGEYGAAEDLSTASFKIPPRCLEEWGLA